MYKETTIAAISTSPGEGGIGVIRLSGTDAARIADEVFHSKKISSFAKAVPYMMYYGHVVDGETVIDEGLGVYMKGPHSYTGEDVVEIQIHGSQEALERALALMYAHGAEPARRGEFTERAFLNGRLDLSQAEAVMDIIKAPGAAALAQAESHLSGALSSFVKDARASLKDMISKLEVTIDYPEEDLDDLTNEEIIKGLDPIEKQLDDLLKRSHEGRVVTEGLRTAIVGKPNAGKSSLLNALLQEDRAIVTNIPGTTRDTIEETLRIGGVPLILMDTAGIRKSKDEVEKIGIERAKETMKKADLVLAVIDGSLPLTEEDKELLHDLKDRKAFIILNKTDLGTVVSPEEIKKEAGEHPVIRLSALNGKGLSDLEEELRQLVKHQDETAGRELLLTNMRHTELVRKALESVRHGKQAIQEGLTAECVAIDLTDAWNDLGEITGDTVDDELIHTIFDRFCVGK